MRHCVAGQGCHDALFENPVHVLGVEMRTVSYHKCEVDRHYAVSELVPDKSAARNEM